MDMNPIGNIVAFCLIMHNTSDRVMIGDVNAFDNPAVSLDKDGTEAGSIHISSDTDNRLKIVYGDDGAETTAVVDIKSMAKATRKKVWNYLIDVEEWRRLQLRNVKLPVAFLLCFWVPRHVFVEIPPTLRQ